MRERGDGEGGERGGEGEGREGREVGERVEGESERLGGGWGKRRGKWRNEGCRIFQSCSVSVITTKKDWLAV